MPHPLALRLWWWLKGRNRRVQPFAAETPGLPGQHGDLRAGWVYLRVIDDRPDPGQCDHLAGRIAEQVRERRHVLRGDDDRASSQPKNGGVGDVRIVADLFEDPRVVPADVAITQKAQQQRSWNFRVVVARRRLGAWLQAAS